MAGRFMTWPHKFDDGLTTEIKLVLQAYYKTSHSKNPSLEGQPHDEREAYTKQFIFHSFLMQWSKILFVCLFFFIPNE